LRKIGKAGEASHSSESRYENGNVTL